VLSFLGEHECKVDAKGRVLLPSRLKAALPPESATSLVIQRGFEKYLVLYTLPEWQKVYQKITSLNEFNEDQRRLQRHFLSGNMEVDLDGAGRLLLPKLMMSHGQIGNEAVMVGVGTRIEVWNPQLYEQSLIKDTSVISRMVERYLGNTQQTSLF
jgi:MraZ protein